MPDLPVKDPHVIVFGNEKGGSGKSTTAMHVTMSLVKLGYQVGVVDLDGRQRTTVRYLENRKAYAQDSGLKLPTPGFAVIERAEEETRTDTEAKELERLQTAIDGFEGADFIVIDCPGADTHLARLAHSIADTLVTPMNDSFIDFDLLATIDPTTLKVLKPSYYSELVWDARKQRALQGREPTDWIVMRNRLQSLDAKNKRRVGRVVANLSERIGFRTAPGFGERVIYRELFPKGLTLLDLVDEASGVPLTMSHIAARQEVRDLIAALEIDGVSDRIQEI